MDALVVGGVSRLWCGIGGRRPHGLGLHRHRLPDPGPAHGGKAIFIIAIPLVGALPAIGTILVRLGYARAGVGTFTWLVIGVLIAFTFQGMLTIGPFVVPLPVCLLKAAVRIKEAEEAQS